MVFAIHQHESATGIHVSLHPEISLKITLSKYILSLIVKSKKYIYKHRYRLTDIESRLIVTQGKRRGGGANLGHGINGYTKQQGFTVQCRSRSNS